MKKSKKIHIPIPAWAGIVYLLFCMVLIPWTVYLSIVLPTHHLSEHWDVSWGGLDVGIIITLLLTAIWAFRRSKWVAMSATAAGTLLIFDAWFDIMSARPGLALFESVFLAVVCEVPVALMSYIIAYHVLDKNLN